MKNWLTFSGIGYCRVGRFMYRSFQFASAVGSVADDAFVPSFPATVLAVRGSFHDFSSFALCGDV